MFDEHSTKSSETFLRHLVEHAPFPIFEIQTDNGTEFTKRLLTRDETDLTLFETLMAEYGIRYHRIRPATPRHNGKVERGNRTDELRFYSKLKMFSLADGRRQLAVYQRKSNDIIMTCLGMRSPTRSSGCIRPSCGNQGRMTHSVIRPHSILFLLPAVKVGLYLLRKSPPFS